MPLETPFCCDRGYFCWKTDKLIIFAVHLVLLITYPFRVLNILGF